MAYFYAAELSSDDVRNVCLALQPYGFSITHAGKTDPPRKRLATFDEAAELVVSTTGCGTNRTFVEDKTSGISLTFEIRDDPRWGYSTISTSLPAQIPLNKVCESVLARLKVLACMGGIAGAGKHQPWPVRVISPDCPASIRAALGETNAEG